MVSPPRSTKIAIEKADQHKLLRNPNADSAFIPQLRAYYGTLGEINTFSDYLFFSKKQIIALRFKL